MTTTQFKKKYILAIGYQKETKSKRFRLIAVDRNTNQVINEVLENEGNSCFKQFMEGKDLNKAILKFKTDAIEEILLQHQVEDYNLSEDEINKYFE